MAFKSGKDSWFALDNVAGTLTNITGYIDNISHPQTVDTLDVSVMGTTAKQFITGLTDGDSLTISGPYDVTIWTHLTAVKAAQAAGSSTATFTWGPGGSVSAQAKSSGECWVVNPSFTTTVAGRVEWSCTLQVTGSITNGTW
jgi:hypothetical protein